MIVAGFMTQMCCDTTAREAAHRGFKVLFLADATAAMDLPAPDGGVIAHDLVHRTHLASLNGFLAQVTTTDALTSAGSSAPLRSPPARALRGLASQEPLRVPNLPPELRGPDTRAEGVGARSNR